MIDKDLALRNIIANQALEGLEMTPGEIERSRAILDGDLSIDEAITQIHLELAAERLGNPHLFRNS